MYAMYALRELCTCEDPKAVTRSEGSRIFPEAGFLEGFQATKDGDQCSSDILVLRAKQQSDLPSDTPLGSLAAQDGGLTAGVAREGALNGQGCRMLAQGTACNKATFFGNASQVVLLIDKYLRALTQGLSSIFVPSSLYRTGHQGAITPIFCPDESTPV